MIIERLNTLPLSVLVPLHNKMGGIGIYSMRDDEAITSCIEENDGVKFDCDFDWGRNYWYYNRIENLMISITDGKTRELLDIDGIEDYLLDIYDCDEFAINRYLETLAA